jgi:hypothetical protein
MLIEESHVAANFATSSADRFIGVQVHLLVLDREPKALDEDMSAQRPLPSMLILVSSPLEHLSYCCRASKGNLNHALASSEVMAGSSSAIA